MYLTDLAIRALQPKPKAGLLLNGAHLYGDSIMEAGIGEQLEQMGIPIKCRAQAGDTAERAWKRFAWDVRCMDTVVLGHGTNDLTAGKDPVPKLRRMAEYALAEGRKVVFTGIPQRDLPSKYDWDQANNDIFDLAIDLQCAHAGWDDTPPSFGPTDKLHPDLAMTGRLVERLYWNLFL